MSLPEIDVLILADRNDADVTLAGAGADSGAVRATTRRTLSPLVCFPSDTAQFCHSTARDLTTVSQQPDHPLYLSYGVELYAAHLLCTKLCLSYILHPRILPDLFNAARSVTTPIDIASPVSDHGGWNGHDLFINMFDIEDVTFLKDFNIMNNEIRAVIQQQWQTFDYAVRNWTCHLKRTGSMLNEDLTAMALSLLPGESVRQLVSRKERPEISAVSVKRSSQRGMGRAPPEIDAGHSSRCTTISAVDANSRFQQYSSRSG